MKDQFNLKEFLIENKLTRLSENEDVITDVVIYPNYKGVFEDNDGNFAEVEYDYRQTSYSPEEILDLVGDKYPWFKGFFKANNWEEQLQKFKNNYNEEDLDYESVIKDILETIIDDLTNGELDVKGDYTQAPDDFNWDAYDEYDGELGYSGIQFGNGVLDPL